MGNWGNTRPALSVFILTKAQGGEKLAFPYVPLGGPRGKEKSAYV